MNKLIIFAVLILKITVFAYDIHMIGEAEPPAPWTSANYVAPLELNDNGLVLVEKKTVWAARAHEGDIYFTSQTRPEIWHIGPGSYAQPDMVSPSHMIMNNEGIVVVQCLNYHEHSLKGTSVFYPNGTSAALSFKNNPFVSTRWPLFHYGDQIVYLDDNGDLLVSLSDNDYYLQNVYDPQGSDRRTTNLSEFNLIPNRFKGIRGPIPTLETLNEEVLASGWEIQKIELANVRGDIVALAANTNAQRYWVFLMRE